MACLEPEGRRGRSRLPGRSERRQPPQPRQETGSMRSLSEFGTRAGFAKGVPWSAASGP